jgi:drug/metabolite transporter (DMT)-like permease
LHQVFYFVGLKYSSAAVASALNNTLPAVTFVLAATLNMEPVAGVAGRAKMAGTVLCMAGSMVMTFYTGPVVRTLASPIHWSYVQRTMGAEATADDVGGQAAILGAVLVIASNGALAVWFIIQKKMSKSFPSPFTSTTLIALMASVQCATIGVAVERDLSAWALGLDIRIIGSLYLVRSNLTCYFRSKHKLQKLTEICLCQLNQLYTEVQLLSNITLLTKP